MPAYLENTTYETLLDALFDSYTVDILRPLAKLVCHNIPSRKIDMVNAICNTMLSAKLKSHFDRLDAIEKAAVQEAAFSPEGELNITQFKAKYHHMPQIGKSLNWPPKGHLVDLFIVKGHVPDDLSNLLIEFLNKPQKDQIKYSKNFPNPFLSTSMKNGGTGAPRP